MKAQRAMVSSEAMALVEGDRLAVGVPPQQPDGQPQRRNAERRRDEDALVLDGVLHERQGIVGLRMDHLVRPLDASGQQHGGDLEGGERRREELAERLRQQAAGEDLDLAEQERREYEHGSDRRAALSRPPHPVEHRSGACHGVHDAHQQVRDAVAGLVRRQQAQRDDRGHLQGDADARDGVDARLVQGHLSEGDDAEQGRQHERGEQAGAVREEIRVGLRVARVYRGDDARARRCEPHDERGEGEQVLENGSLRAALVVRRLCECTQHGSPPLMRMLALGPHDYTASARVLPGALGSNRLDRGGRLEGGPGSLGNSIAEIARFDEYPL